MPDVTRFAPSPTGYLHLGHARAAFFAADHGRMLLRIEDIDVSRCRPAFEDGIREDLTWLGLTWPTPIRRQSEHFPAYRAAVDRLRRDGLSYPCFCTRADIEREIAGAASAPHGPDGPLYPGTCRGLSEGDRARRVAAGEPHAWRLDLAAAASAAGPLQWIDRARGPQTATPEIFGDVVIARKDIPASYHLACVWDDALQGVTLVTRGNDLFSVTHVHRLLQALLGLPTPAYHHHDLLVASDGRKFSKRDAGVTLRALREQGRSPADVRQMALA